MIIHNKGSARQMWLWWGGEQKRQPEILYEYERSEISGWQFSETGEDAGLHGRALFVAKRTSLQRLLAYNVLPWISVPLVRGEALRLFRNLPVDQVEIFPVEVKCVDGVSMDFFAVRPKISAVCTDFDRSDIEWEREGDLYLMWKHLEFLPNCMAGKSIVRERYSRCIVVCNELKEEIQRQKLCGIEFVRPEESRSGFAPWVK